MKFFRSLLLLRSLPLFRSLLLISLLLPFAAFGQAAAGASKQASELGPDELVRKVTDDVLNAIKNDKQLAAGDKQKALKLAEEKVLPHIDFAEATRLAVGRSWKQASAEQKKELTEQFRRMLVRTYANAIGPYEGQTMKVAPSRQKPDDKEATVRSQFVRAGGKPVQLEYQMRKTDAGWKVYDIVVEGVSLVLTYRSEFDAVVKQQGIDGLIKRLSEKNSPPKIG